MSSFMTKTLKLVAGLAVVFTLANSVHAVASEGFKEPEDHHFTFEGPFGSFDQAQLQRGYKVYREVCSACHSMHLMSFRNLGQKGGPFYDPKYKNPNDNPIVKQIASEYDVAEIDPDTGLEVNLITGEEYAALHEGAARFEIYIENDEGSAFTNSALLEAMLLSPAVFATIDTAEKVTVAQEIEALEDGDIPAKYILDITNDPVDNSLNVTVGTGDADKNLAIAAVLYDMISNKELTLLENKNVSMLSDPHAVVIENGPEKTEEEEGLVPVGYAVMAVAVLIAGTVLGILIAFSRLFFKKEITDVFNYRESDQDTIIDLSLFNEGKIDDELVHTIQYPSAQRKLILSDPALPAEIQGRLLKDTATNYVLASDIVAVDPKLSFDEIILVSQQNVTNKAWYKKQRTLLTNYTAPIKIVLQ